MREIPTFLQSRLETSVRIGPLYYPANAVAEYLRNFCAPCLFHSEYSRPFHLSKGGSVSFLKYRNRFFAMTSLHQFSKARFDYSQLVIGNPARRTLVTPEAAVFPMGSVQHQEDFDCVRLEFSAPVANNLLSEHLWFDLSSSAVTEPQVDPVICFCIGYPGYRNFIDYDQMSYAVAPNAVWGEAKPSALKGRKAFIPIGKLDYEPEGMSGAPVFRIDLEGTSLCLNFAGVLTEATSSMFNYISIDRIFPAFFADS